MSLSAQIERVSAAVRTLDAAQGRILVAIAGPPASGKSTLAKGVRDRLDREGLPCGLVQMDGFHLDNETLKRRDMLARKGAPETFDLHGFTQLMERLRAEDDVALPLFDRVLDQVIPDSGRVTKAQRHVIVEGNYLFLKDGGWRNLADFWTYSVFVDPSIETLRTRLIDRWLTHGLDAAAAEQRATQNDLKNAARVLENIDRSNIDLVLT